jgi:hypothetical protein
MRNPGMPETREDRARGYRGGRGSRRELHHIPAGSCGRYDRVRSQNHTDMIQDQMAGT